jgi:hypothetical protein
MTRARSPSRRLLGKALSHPLGWTVLNFVEYGVLVALGLLLDALLPEFDEADRWMYFALAGAYLVGGLILFTVINRSIRHRLQLR